MLLPVSFRLATAFDSKYFFQNTRSKQLEEKFDVVLSRAFASLQDMLFWCKHLPNEKGHFLALKGQFPELEVAQLNESFEFIESISLQVPNLEGERCLVKIKGIQL